MTAKSDRSPPALVVSASPDPLMAIRGALGGAGPCPVPSGVFEGPLPELSPEESGPVATYGRVGGAVAALVASLAEKKAPRRWRVVFGCGTVVEASKGSEFRGFTADNSQFPTHRVSDEKAFINYLQGNRLAWAKLRSMSGDVGAAARRGLATLVCDGYPYPGGAGADRTVREEKGFWRVDWPARDPRIFNIWARTDLDSEHAVACSVADLRRYDSMTPRVFAVITPDLAVCRVGPALV